MSEQYCEAFSVLTDLVCAVDVAPLKNLPGMWEYQVSPEWWIAVNPHRGKAECSHGAEVEFGNCYIEFNGWPAGFITPYGGCIAAGALANEDTFIAAMKAKLEELVKQ